MRHQVRGNRLNRPADHRRAMLRNMVTSLFKSERITTTVTKAKTARRFADRMITFAKKGDLNSRRQAARFINDPKVLQKLFAEIGPRYSERPGGYTRVIKAGTRKGDDAPMAILELITSDYKPKDNVRKAPKVEAYVGGAPKAKKEAAPAEEAPVDEAAAPEADAGEEKEA